jgi:hypothetical protein
MKRALLLLAVALLLVLAFVDAYFWLRPRMAARPAAPVVPSPRVVAVTAAPTVPAPTAPTEPSPVVAEAKPPVKPVVPKPKHIKPSAPPVTSAPPRPAPEHRGFVPRTTDIEGESGSGSRSSSSSVPAGFDAGGVQAKRVPKIAAQIEFDIQPKPVRAGDAYAVRIYLRNEGKKAVKIKELRVGSSLNGARSEAALTPKLKEVPPEQVGLLTEISSVWKANVTAWGIDVTVRSGHGEIYKNSVDWR